jgi:hypothetical protein
MYSSIFKAFLEGQGFKPINPGKIQL